ncbi:MAG: amino acid transporter [Acidimicrobiia bacterium]|nr:amino acid transporter [Acidimicrobiia bacterium]
MTGPAAVHGLLNLLEDVGIECVVAGGWGVDALVGRQTRDHGDLDVILPADDESTAIEALTGAGFEISTDWRPIRFAMTHPDGREIDLHPVRQGPAGSMIQEVFEGHLTYPADEITTGIIDRRLVRCISAALQIRFHDGYEPQEKDRADVATLCAATGLEPPAAYR